ncbi:MAG: N-formylglutamate deformylase [Rhodospirillales bacterium]|jgi:N-formylglutamate deformylase
MTATFVLHRGDSPLVVSAPHVGTYVPAAILGRLTPEAAELADTDWHVERLYEFARDLGASTIAATHSRLVVDLNRDPSGKPLYPGASNTEICPLGTFADGPVYRDGTAPDEAEIARRIETCWRPYHAALAAELERVRQRFGVAVLWDAHSIVSRAPRFFAGKLPDFNLGTADGDSCDPGLAQRVNDVLAAATGFTSVHNGRFKGGYITRSYGRPGQGLHALQLEMAQSSYMVEGPPFAWDPAMAARVRPVLRACLEACLAWARGAQ